MFSAIQIGILVEESGTELKAQHILYGAFQRLRLHQSQVDGLLQVLVVGTEGEVDVVAAIDGRSRFHYSPFFTIPFSLFPFQRKLVDGGVIAHHHTVEAYIVAKDVLQDFAVGHTLRTMNGMIAGHDALAARETDHRLMGQQYFLHQLFLVGIAATAVA